MFQRCRAGGIARPFAGTELPAIPARGRALGGAVPCSGPGLRGSAGSGMAGIPAGPDGSLRARIGPGGPKWSPGGRSGSLRARMDPSPA